MVSSTGVACWSRKRHCWFFPSQLLLVVHGSTISRPYASPPAVNLQSLTARHRPLSRCKHHKQPVRDLPAKQVGGECAHLDDVHVLPAVVCADVPLRAVVDAGALDVVDVRPALARAARPRELMGPRGLGGGLLRAEHGLRARCTQHRPCVSAHGRCCGWVLGQVAAGMTEMCTRRTSAVPRLDRPAVLPRGALLAASSGARVLLRCDPCVGSPGGVLTAGPPAAPAAL